MSTNNEWNEIVAWLQCLTYGDYACKFKNGGYDLWEIIYELSENDLKDIGIKPGHAKRIKKQLLIHKESKTKHASNNNTNNNHKQRETDKDEAKHKSASSSSISLQNKIQNVVKSNSSQKESAQQKQMAHAQHLQQLQIEERKRKIRERFQQNALFAGGIKNKLFETMTRVLNGLQQELIQYNGKFAEPINEMNQRIVALQKLDVHNLDGIWDSNDGLFEPMMRNVKDIKKFNNSMWGKINEFHNLAESQIKQSMKQLQQKITIINQMKTQYFIKQHQINALKRQIVQQQQYKQPPMNTIVVNSNSNSSNNNNTNSVASAAAHNSNNNKDQSAKALVSNVTFSNLNNQFNYAALNNILPQLNKAKASHSHTTNNGNVSSSISLPNSSANDFKMKETNAVHKKKNNALFSPKKKEIKKKKKHKNSPRVAAGRKPAYTSGELQMMQNYDKKKQTVADIIELQRKMQAIYGIPRSAYGIAQKMYRMGVLSATLPKKLQALQDKPDADKIKIGDGIMNVRKPRGKPRKVSAKSKSHSRSESPSDSYYSSNDDEDDASSSSSDSDDISSNSSDSDHSHTKNNAYPNGNSNGFQSLVIAQPAPNSMTPTNTNSRSSSLLVLNMQMEGYHNGDDTLVPQRKPPSTNLRRYTQEEVNFIRRLIESEPTAEAKQLFNKFRAKFVCWKEDTESYTKFYQKKWRLCKEKESSKPYALNTLKRKRSVSNTNSLESAAQLQTNIEHPPLKRAKVNNAMNVNINNYNTLPPLINDPKTEPSDNVSFDGSIMPKLPFVLSNDAAKESKQSPNNNHKENTSSSLSLPVINKQKQPQAEGNTATQDIKTEIMPPPLPPPPEK